VLVVDTGNSLFGKEPSNSSQGALQIQAMNLMGYDAMAWGETDLAVPAEVLQERFAKATFAAISTNLGPADQLPLQPYVLKEMAGHTVAILGATAPAAAKRTQPGIALTVEPPLEAISRTVAGLRGQADVIVVLSNLTAAENEALALQVPGIDVLLGAHDTGAKIGSRTVNGPEGSVVVAVTYRQGQFLGQLNVRFDSAGRVVSFAGQDLTLTDKYADDPAMLEFLATYGVTP
jgi:5'-nucleotidase/UDP-sugar diphosphatase